MSSPRVVLETLAASLRGEAHHLVREASLFYPSLCYRLQLGGADLLPLEPALRDAAARYDRRSRPWLEPVRITPRPTPLFTLSGHTGAVIDCAISPDSRFAASTGQDLTARVWDLESGEVIHVLGTPAVLDLPRNPRAMARYTLLRMMTGYAGTVRACAFSRNGRYLVTVGPGEELAVWDVRVGVECCRLREIAGHVQGCQLLSDPEGTPDEPFRAVLVYSSLDAGVGIGTAFDIVTGRSQRIEELESPGVVQHIGSPDGGRIVTLGERGIPKPQENSPDEALMVADMIWLNRHDRHGGMDHRGRAVALGNRYFLIADVKDAYALDLDGKEVRALKGSDSLITCCAVRGALGATGAMDGTIRVWDLDQGRLLETLGADSESPVHGCAFAPNGDFLLTADGHLLTEDFSGRSGLLRAWPLRFPEPGEQQPPSPIKALGFGPEAGPVVSVREDGRVQLHASAGTASPAAIDLGARVVGPCLATRGEPPTLFAATESGLQAVRLGSSLPAPTTLEAARVNTLASSPDGRRLAAGLEDGTLRVWDTATSQALFSEAQAAPRIQRLLVTPDGDEVVTVCGPTVRVAAVERQRSLPLLDGKRSAAGAWRELGEALEDQGVPARPLDSEHYVEEFLDAGFAPHGGLITVSRLAPVGDPHAFQFVLTRGGGIDSARHLDPFPSYVLLSLWDDRPRLGSGPRRVAVMGEEHARVHVGPEGSWLVWVTRYLGAFRITSFDVESGAKLGEVEVGSSVPVEAAVALASSLIATVAADGLVTLRRLPDFEVLGSVFIEIEGLVRLALDPERGVLAAGYRSGSVDLFRLRQLIPVPPVPPRPGGGSLFAAADAEAQNDDELVETNPDLSFPAEEEELEDVPAEPRPGSPQWLEVLRRDGVEHLVELGRLIRVVPLWWFGGTLLSLAFLAGPWSDRALLAPMYGLAFGYAALIVQGYRFAGPAFLPAEKKRSWLILPGAALGIGLLLGVLALAAWPIELFWVRVTGVVRRVDPKLLIAKANAMALSFAIPVAVLLGGGRGVGGRSAADAGARSRRWRWAWLLLTLAPAIGAAVTLAVGLPLGLGWMLRRSRYSGGKTSSALR